MRFFSVQRVKEYPIAVSAVGGKAHLQLRPDRHRAANIILQRCNRAIVSIGKYEMGF
jgi:hypothetical protein